jgi:hypothetical protein
MKVALRVAARLGREGIWPTLRDFQREAADCARRLGFSLRGRDGGEQRLSIGYPVGDDPEKSVARFVNSFTILERDGRTGGPLFSLGLATVCDGRVVLTRDGWRLAAAPSPIIDGAQGITISSPEAKIFRDAIARTNGEREAALAFLRCVESNGQQNEVDAHLSRTNPRWSREQVIAHRAAMAGRLGEAELVAASGRGGNALLQLLPAADHFISRVAAVDARTSALGGEATE